MGEERYIHIRNFGRFQRFRDRRPTWIRLHFDLVDNDDFLALSEHQQALLIFLWITYAKRVRSDTEGLFNLCRGLPEDSAKLGRSIGRRVRKDSVKALSDAGFIEILETETVTIGAGSVPLEVRDLDKNLARTREDPKPAQADRPRIPFQGSDSPSKKLERALAFVRNAGCQYERKEFDAEIERMDLTNEERGEAETLYADLRAALAAEQNGQVSEELPFEGVEPPVVAD